MKRKILIIFLPVLILLTIYNNVSAVGFNSICTPDGVNIIAVGDHGLVFRSSNAGNSWASYTHGIDNFNSVFSLDNDVWIGASNGNIYKTMKTISPIIVYNVGSSHTINSIYFINTKLGFVCCDSGHVYKSTDSGLTWISSASGLFPIALNAIYFLDEKQGAIAGNNGNIYLTGNGGNSWIKQSAVLTSRNLRDIKYFADGIIAVGEYGTILTKQNTGDWISVVTRTFSDIRAITGPAFRDVSVCGGGGFIRNNRSGVNNFYSFEINPMLADLADVFYYNDYIGFAVSSLNNAIIKTSNGGASWDLTAGSTVTMNWTQKLSSSSGYGNSLCLHPFDRNSAFVAYNKKVYASRNRSETWTQIATIEIGTRAHTFFVSPLDTNIWLALMHNSTDTDCVVRTTNYGVTWTKIITKDFNNSGRPLEMDQNNPSVFYFAPSNVSGEGIYKSTNIGASFTLISQYNNSNIDQPSDLVIVWDSSNVLYMGDQGADIWKSTNSALTWTLVKPESSFLIPSLCNSVFEKNVCYATTYGSSQVYKSNNFGATWNVVSNNSGSGWGSDICREDPTVVLTGNYGEQSFLSTNGGANFFNVNSGLDGGGAAILVPERGYLLNMQAIGLYKMNIVYSVLTTINENTVSVNAPEKFELFQNYPNPFNPTTVIKFAILNSGNISLKVYDRLGKEVADLADGFRSAGIYEINFDASQLSSGIYFYELIANGSIISKKMTLIK